MTDDRLTLAQQIGLILEDEELKAEILGQLAPQSGGRRGSQFDRASKVKNFDPSQPIAEIGQLEQIILKIGRPVLFVRDDGFTFPKELKDRESQVWKERLEGAMEKIKCHIPSVGRINVENHETFKWLGTGWLIAENIGVSNAHVVDQFAMKSADGSGYTFRQNFRRRSMSASIDFKVEFESPARNEFQIEKVLYIGEKGPSGNYDPDIALFQIASQGGIGKSKEGESIPAVLGTPVCLANHLPDRRDQVAVIGYPAFDSRVPDADLMRRIFGDDYDLKRLAPGTIMDVDNEFHIVRHDASTLGGNSGSVILDLKTGEAVGLHFAGSFMDANYAVPALAVRDALDRFGG
jgi:endonuclease G